jgi:hypothetical protein
MSTNFLSGLFSSNARGRNYMPNQFFGESYLRPFLRNLQYYTDPLVRGTEYYAPPINTLLTAAAIGAPLFSVVRKHYGEFSDKLAAKKSRKEEIKRIISELDKEPLPAIEYDQQSPPSYIPSAPPPDENFSGYRTTEDIPSAPPDENFGDDDTIYEPGGAEVESVDEYNQRLREEFEDEKRQEQREIERKSLNEQFHHLRFWTDTLKKITIPENYEGKHDTPLDSKWTYTREGQIGSRKKTLQPTRGDKGTIEKLNTDLINPLIDSIKKGEDFSSAIGKLAKINYVGKFKYFADAFLDMLDNPESLRRRYEKNLWVPQQLTDMVIAAKNNKLLPQ